MDTSHGDLLALLGLMEGRTSAVDGIRLRERLETDITLRKRWHRLRTVAADLGRTGTASEGEPAVGAETIAALLEGRLAAREARGVESILWDSDALLAEAISTYRFLTGGASTSSAPRPEATERLLTMFLAASTEAVATTMQPTRTRRSRTIDPPEPPETIEDTSDPGPVAEHRPPVVRHGSTRRRPKRSTNRWVTPVLVITGLAIVGLGAALFLPRGSGNDSDVARDEGDRVDPSIADDDGRDIDHSPDPDPVPVPQDPVPPPEPLVARAVVGAMFVRGEESTSWRVPADDEAIVGTCLVPEQSWVRLEVGTTSLVLAGPTEIEVADLGDGANETREVRVRSGRVAVRGGGKTIRVALDGDETITTRGVETEFTVAMVGSATVLRLIEGSLSVGERVVDRPTVLARRDAMDWEPRDVRDPGPAWREPPTSPPAGIDQLVAATRGAGDPVGSLLMSAESARAPLAPLAARWAFELDPDRTVDTLVEHGTDQADLLLLALTTRSNGPADRIDRSWAGVARRLGDRQMAGRLRAWHDLAASRTPLDLETGRELLRGLNHSHLLVRSAAIRTLRRKTGANHGYDPRGDAASRMRAQRAWAMELRQRFTM